MNALTYAAAAVIEDDAGRVLLCQQSHGHRLWALLGGKIRDGESPTRAVRRDVYEETGSEIEIVDLVGLYQVTGGADLPDLLVHVFRARLRSGEATLNAPSRICRLAWHDPRTLPTPTTPTARAAIADAVRDRSGVLREVRRDPEPVYTETAAATPMGAAVVS
ncbi:MAG TPA: NUDIX hydrolase [Micromonosporaceae bacterium]